MKLRNSVCAAALAVAGVLGAASAAEAQTYNRIVVFGDSLSDNGNINIASGGAQPGTNYTGGRFSNGPVWVELLGFGTLGSAFGPKTGNVDMAWGGARTDTLGAWPPNPWGTDTQLTNYITGGGVFGANDLVTMWAGANNVIQAITGVPSPTSTSVGTAATIAAMQVGGQVNAIAGAGAGTVLVANLPELQSVPLFNGGLASAAAPLALIGSSTFNTTLHAQLATAAGANPNANIIEMDVARAFRALLADPGRFGFTNVTTPCMVPGPAADCSSPGTSAFWDPIHPTAAAHRLVASVATDYLTYGDRAVPTAVEAEAGVSGRRAAFDAARDRLGDRSFDSGTRTFAHFEGSTAKTEPRGMIGETKLTSGGLRLGVEHAYSSNLRIGATAGALQTNADTGALTFDLNSYTADLYGGWRSAGGLFVDAAAGFSADNYKDIRRVTALAAAVHQGATDGTSWGADLRVGWAGEVGGWSISPRVGVTTVHTQVDGYEEEGAAARHKLADREIDATSAEASVLFSGDVSEKFVGTFELGYRDWVSYDGEAVTVSLVDNTAHALSRTVEEVDGGAFMLDAAIGGQLTDNVDLRFGYRGRFADSYDSHTGGVTISFRY